jgi:hypothetical protein
MMAKQNFKKSTLKMKPNHTWKAPDGYKIIVLDRGAVSFNIPEKWVLHKLDPVEIYDKKPPKDDCRLNVSFWHLPPGVDWTGLPLSDLLSKATQPDDLDILERGQIVQHERDDLDMVWIETRFLDKTEKREAFSRSVTARGWNVQVLMTFDFWLSDAPRLIPVWNEVLRSLQLGRIIQDPTKGVTFH